MRSIAILCFVVLKPPGHQTMHDTIHSGSSTTECSAVAALHTLPTNTVFRAWVAAYITQDAILTRPSAFPLKLHSLATSPYRLLSQLCHNDTFRSSVFVLSKRVFCSRKHLLRPSRNVKPLLGHLYAKPTFPSTTIHASYCGRPSFQSNRWPCQSLGLP